MASLLSLKALRIRISLFSRCFTFYNTCVGIFMLNFEVKKGSTAQKELYIYKITVLRIC